MRFSHIQFVGILAAALVSFPSLSSAQCTEPATTDFRTVTLVAPSTSNNLSESGASEGPVQIAVASDGRVFVARMHTGTIVVYKPGSNAVSPVGQIPTYFNTEDGLLGIALDPNFATNHWIYADYSDPCGQNCTNRAIEVARFTVDTTVTGSLTATGQLTNKKVLLRFAREKDDTHHAAGGMAFFANGVLVIGTGDNSEPTTGNHNAGYGPIYYGTPTGTKREDAQRSAANTNDLRGKVLRIKPIAFADNTTPTPGIGGTYDIPSGNLWEKINLPAFNPGWDNTDTLANVRKEIFTFGHRNPYHPRVDNRSGWIFWGEVGPDANNARTGSTSQEGGPAGHEEWNLAAAPGFYGHPYCNGKSQPYTMITSIASSGTATYSTSSYDCQALVNTSPNNTGIHHLPPAVPAVVAYASADNTGNGGGTGDSRFGSGQETAISGPMYRYDPASTSTVKFPPYYEGKILFFEWTRRIQRVMVMNPNGTIDSTAAAVRSFSPNGLPKASNVDVSYIDAQFGPEGALYLLKFSDNAYTLGAGAGLYRVEYTGSYNNSCYQPFTATVTGPDVNIPTSIFSREIRKNIAPLMGNGFLTLPAGYRSVQLYNISGRMIWTFGRTAADYSEEVKLPTNLSQGVLQAKLIP